MSDRYLTPRHIYDGALIHDVVSSFDAIEAQYEQDQQDREADGLIRTSMHDWWDDRPIYSADLILQQLVKSGLSETDAELAFSRDIVHTDHSCGPIIVSGSCDE